ncbi:MAG: LysR family transcriptional regulator [Lautropia sp.]
MNQLSLKHLRVFCAVAECLSITQAAQMLHRTQPALSRQLAELEAHFGVALFERRGRTLSLTPEGDDLYGRSRTLLGGAKDLEARAQRLAAGDAHTLRLGAMTLTLETIVPAILAAYRKTQPHVDVRLIEADIGDLMRYVEAGELDLAVSREVNSDAILSSRLFPMHMVAIMHAGHPLARKKRLEISDLEKEPLLLTPPDSGSRVLLARVCQAEGLRLRDIRIESRSYGGLAALAETGYGVALMLSTVALGRPDAKVIPVRHRGELLHIWFSSIRHRRRELPPHAQAFVKTAEEVTRVYYPRRVGRLNS